MSYNNRMVAHLWANQSKEYAKNNNGSLYFEDKIIYSYGEHYPIAKLFPGKGVVLLNSESSSVTTEKHKRIVWGAVDTSKYNRSS